MTNTIIASLLGLALYSGTLAAQHGVNGTPDGQSCVTIGQWVLTADDKTISTPRITEQLVQHHAVLLGEDHDNPEHHRWQLYTIAELYARQPNMALGFEAFPRRVQPILDKWVAGELSEQAFLKAVDWRSIWTYDANYYLPIFNFARMNHIPMYALNVDRELVSAVGEKGWENIPPDMREGVTDPAPPSDDYLELLAAIYGRHTSGHEMDPGQTPKQDLEDPAFRRFVQSQLVWDRAMAEVMANTLKNTNTQLFVGVMGAGHIIGGYGIPHQLDALGVKDSASLLPWDGTLDCDQLQPDLAYAVFGMKLPDTTVDTSKPRLGVFLDKDDRGVKIVRVTPDSVAAATGLEAGDVIVEIAGKPATRLSTVVETVQNTAFGTWLPLTVVRGDKTLDLVAKFPPENQ